MNGKSTLLDKRMDRVVLNDPQEELDNDDGAIPLTLDETSKRAAKKEKNRRSHDSDKEKKAAIKYGLSTSTSRLWTHDNYEKVKTTAQNESADVSRRPPRATEDAKAALALVRNMRDEMSRMMAELERLDKLLSSSSSTDKG